MSHFSIIILDKYTDKYLNDLWSSYVTETIINSNNESIQLLNNYTELTLNNIWKEYVAETIEKSKFESLNNKTQKCFNFFC